MKGTSVADENRPPLAEIVVGDRFWLAYAQDAVRGAVKAPEARAAQLASTIAWFWTVYSAAGVLAIAFGSERLHTPLGALVGVPSALLIFAYWKASVVGRPLLFHFDPRVPAEIERAFTEAAGIKQASLRSAEFWTGAAAVLVVLGLSAAFLLPAPGKTSLTARFDPTDSTRLLVVAEVARDTMVTFTAAAASAPAGAPSSAVALARASREGVASATLRVTPGDQRVTAAWVDDRAKVDRSMSVNVGK